MPKGYSSITGLPHQPPNHKGKSKPESMRKLLSERNKGNKYAVGREMSDEHRRILLAVNLGNKYNLGNNTSVDARRKNSEAKKGAKNFFWQGGKTKEHFRIRHGLEYRLWRERVFERDNYTCVFCGDNRGHNLEADHIKPFSVYPELRFDVDNGRTLCNTCHKKTPTYGNKGVKYVS